ncbi:MAG: T9SS type A sorting domain-containing protein [Salinivirgaceae bacterium]|nr:T9SS type A sorting domain-containing protein [Salinivirgaceae bacterium]
MKQIIFISGLMLLSQIIFAQWSDSPAENLRITNSDNEKSSTKIATCSNGNYYVGYFASSESVYTVRLQLVSSQGALLWGDNGIEVSNKPTMSWVTDWDMSVDSENNAILTWTDTRLDGDLNVVASKVSQSGDFIWGADGILLSASVGMDIAPKVVVTGGDDVVIAWQSNYVIIMQRISATGLKMWGDWGITLSSTNRYTWPQLMAVGDNDIIMKYFEDSGQTMYPIRHIKAQRYDSNGLPVWDNSVIVSNAGTISSWTQILSFVSDGNEGFYMAWHDYRFSGINASSWVQHVNSEGVVQFPENGALLSTSNSANQFEPKIVLNESSSDIMVLWRETNGNQNQYGVYGQKVNSLGVCQWNDGGKVIIPLESTNIYLEYCLSYVDDILMVFREEESLIKARRLKSSGENVWDQADSPISTSGADKSDCVISSFANNQWVAFWIAPVNDTTNVFAQNFRPDGSLGINNSSGIISGQISIEGNMVPVEEIIITVDDDIYHPNDEGIYSIEIESGAYSIRVSHPYIITQEATSVVVTGGETVSMDFTVLVQRRDIVVSVTDQWGDNISGAFVRFNYPEAEFVFTSGESDVTLAGFPYGRYVGSAELSEAVYTTVSVDTIIDGENGNIDFMFIIGGIDESVEKEQLMVYPQPISENSVVDVFLHKGGVYQIQLVSVHGKETIKLNPLFLNAGDNTVQLSEIISRPIPSGIYFLTLYTEDGIFSRTVKMIR